MGSADKQREAFDAWEQSSKDEWDVKEQLKNSPVLKLYSIGVCILLKEFFLKSRNVTAQHPVIVSHLLQYKTWSEVLPAGLVPQIPTAGGTELFIPTDCVVGAQHLGLDVKIHIQTPEDATWFCTAALLTIQPPWIVDSPVVVPRVLQSCCEVCLSCAAEQPCSTICCLQLHRSSPQAAGHRALNPVLYVPVTCRTKAKAISHTCSSSLPLSPTP